jgi:hypothetical protein
MKEGEIVRRIIKAVKEAYPDYFVVKLSDRFIRGLPDVMVLYRQPNDCVGVLFVEVKTLTGSTSAIQDAMLERLDNMQMDGLIVMIARSPEEVLQELKTRGAC